MSQSIITLLSTRYIHAALKQGPLRTMMWLCFGGITIGSFSLMMTVIITQGFEIEIGKQLKGINSDLIITAPGNQLEYTDLKKHLLTKMGTRIAGISGSHTRQILLQNNGMQGVAAARGVIAADEGSTTTLEKSLYPQHSLAVLLAKKHHIIVGAKLAQLYEIRVGDTLDLLLPITHSSGITVTKQPAYVAGTFKVGLEEYDANIVYTSFETLKSWFGDIHGMQQVAVNLQTPTLAATALAWWHNLKRGSLLPWSAEHFKKMLTTYIRATLSGLQVHSWKELYPAIVDSLAMETYVSGLVLALIMLVASMNMISLLFMLMQYKQKDIAILRAMGASPTDIHSLFIWLGIRLVLYGATIGIGTAAFIGWYIHTYKPIQISEAYYISYLPAHVGILNVAIITSIVIGLGYLATRFAARNLSHFSVLETLRRN